jgi:SAM-dependent methyltransferase
MNSRDRTIEDFGEQWLKYSDNRGYYGSIELFSDILHPFLDPGQIAGLKVAEVGSGTGRIVNMLLRSGARHVIAVEPSEAFGPLCKNLTEPEKVTCLNIRGDELPPFGDLDYVFSIGVLHHIPDPSPVVGAAYRALRPGGQFLVWLYGKEGNNLYLLLVKPLRKITKHLPHFLLASLVEAVYWPMMLYVDLCRALPFPLRRYLVSVFSKMSPEKRRLIIYDQLNPNYAKYYSRSEAEKLLLACKFIDVRCHHRHGYSWTVIGTKASS